jgi:hypothetical protein
MNRLLAPAVALGLLSSVVLANYLSSEYGLVSAGFGLLVSAGTYAAGLALGLRDALHEVGGVRWVLGAIAAGIVVSLFMGDGRIALASAVAFGVAELLDLCVYAPLRRRNWRIAVAASNAIGAVADTLLFLWIAGFPMTAQSIGGQILVKAIWMTLLALIVGEGIVRSRKAATA